MKRAVLHTPRPPARSGPPPSPRTAATVVARLDYLSLCTVLGILDQIQAGPHAIASEAFVAEARTWLQDTMAHFTYEAVEVPW